MSLLCPSYRGYEAWWYIKEKMTDDAHFYKISIFLITFVVDAHLFLSIVPTTITETTLGIQACSTIYTSYRECSVQQSTFCPSVQTVTMEITKHTTSKDIETTLKTPLAEKFVGSECAETSTV